MCGHNMSWVSSWYTCLLIWMAEAALALSRTPLIVFQHEVINFASEDLVHEILSQTTTLPDNYYHHYKTTKHLRTLYQIGVSTPQLYYLTPQTLLPVHLYA